MSCPSFSFKEMTYGVAQARRVWDVVCSKGYWRRKPCTTSLATVAHKAFSGRGCRNASVAVLVESPLSGEGHRKAKAMLFDKDVRTPRSAHCAG